MPLDPDDSRPPYAQVAGALRAAILTKRIGPGERLPSQTQLAEQYGVARMTIQSALKVLRDEGLIVSRAGSGVFARERTERPVGLRPYVEQAFREDQVTLDFAGFSGETLHGALTEPLDRLREGGQAPSALRVRVLVPDPSRPWAVPCAVEDRTDDPAFRHRMESITRRHLSAVSDQIQELGDLGLVERTSVECRVHPAVPLFKLYVINSRRAFFGFYPVKPHTVQISGEAHAVFDLMGKDATLFQYEADSDPESLGSQYVLEAQKWFDSIWTNLAQPFDL